MKITDEMLIEASYRGRTVRKGDKDYRVVYEDGTVVVFTLNTVRAYRKVADEYGFRFLGGVRVAGIERLI